MPEGESVAKTPNGNGCQRNADCASDVCLEGYCALKEDSASTRKGNVPNGTRCSDNSECQSGYCINSVCQADDTPDNTQKANGGGCIWNDDNCASGYCHPEFKTCANKNQFLYLYILSFFTARLLAHLAPIHRAFVAIGYANTLL